MKERIESLEKTIKYDADMLWQLKACMDDPRFFIEKYIQANHPTHGIIPIHITNQHTAIINNLHDNRYSLNVISRQSSQTLMNAAYMLWILVFKSNLTNVFVSNKLANAREFISIVKDMYFNLPEWMRPEIEYNNKSEFGLSNGSRLLVQALNANTARGMTISNIIIENLAHVDQSNAIQFFENMWPVFSSSMRTKIMISSVPSKNGNDFFETFCKDAMEGRGEFNLLRLTALEFIGRDENFKKEMIAMIGQEAWDIEYDCKFSWERNSGA